jgi:hypothetical protein
MTIPYVNLRKFSSNQVLRCTATPFQVSNQQNIPTSSCGMQDSPGSHGTPLCVSFRRVTSEGFHTIARSLSLLCGLPTKAEACSGSMIWATSIGTSWWYVAPLPFVMGESYSYWDETVSGCCALHPARPTHHQRAPHLQSATDRFVARGSSRSHEASAPVTRGHILSTTRSKFETGYIVESAGRATKVKKTNAEFTSMQPQRPALCSS